MGKDGAPHLTTLSYIVVDGRIAFWTYGSSQKIRNLERDPRMTGVSDFAELGDLGRSEVVRQTRKRVGVLVTPETVATWDHRKLAAGARAGRDGK